MRLFGQTFPDLFSWLAAEMGVLPLPRRGRERATRNPLFLKNCPGLNWKPHLADTLGSPKGQDECKETWLF
jgi:hypothetical protein